MAAPKPHTPATAALVAEAEARRHPSNRGLAAVRRSDGCWEFTVDGGNAWEALAWPGEAETAVVGRAAALFAAPAASLAEAALAAAAPDDWDAGNGLIVGGVPLSGLPAGSVKPAAEPAAAALLASLLRRRAEEDPAEAAGPDRGAVEHLTELLWSASGEAPPGLFCAVASASGPGGPGFSVIVFGPVADDGGVPARAVLLATGRGPVDPAAAAVFDPGPHAPWERCGLPDPAHAAAALEELPPALAELVAADDGKQAPGGPPPRTALTAVALSPTRGWHVLAAAAAPGGPRGWAAIPAQVGTIMSGAAGEMSRQAGSGAAPPRLWTGREGAAILVRQAVGAAELAGAFRGTGYDLSGPLPDPGAHLRTSALLLAAVGCGPAAEAAREAVPAAVAAGTAEIGVLDTSETAGRRAAAAAQARKATARFSEALGGALAVRAAACAAEMLRGPGDQRGLALAAEALLPHLALASRLGSRRTAAAADRLHAAVGRAAAAGPGEQDRIEAAERAAGEALLAAAAADLVPSLPDDPLSPCFALAGCGRGWLWEGDWEGEARLAAAEGGPALTAGPGPGGRGRTLAADLGWEPHPETPGAAVFATPEECEQAAAAVSGLFRGWLWAAELADARRPPMPEDPPFPPFPPGG